MNFNLSTICLGSNTADGPVRINQALKLLKKEGWQLLAVTDVYQTSSPYFNCLAFVAFADDYDAANRTAKEVERAIGRTPESKAAGIVPIDIDIVIYGTTIARPNDYESAYFQQGFTLLEQKLSYFAGKEM